MKGSNDFSEDFVVVQWGERVRRGPTSYRHNCRPAAFPVDSDPAWPPSGSGCGKPYPAPIHHFNAKVHMKGREYHTLDSTPIVGPDANYCAAIGYTDGRAWCPVRTEGSRDRVECESWRVGKARGHGARRPDLAVQGWRDPRVLQGPAGERLRESSRQPVRAAGRQGRHLRDVRPERRVRRGRGRPLTVAGAGAASGPPIGTPDCPRLTAVHAAWKGRADSMSRFASVDSHCHIDMPQFDADRDEVVARAREAGLVEMLVVGGVDEARGPPAGARGGRRASAFPATAGVHPHEARIADEAVYDELRGLAREGRIVAIGEIGLDFHYDHSPRDVQREVFRRQIRLAREVGLPIVVHTREADDETADILGAGGRRRDGRRHPLLHRRRSTSPAGRSSSAS